MGSKIFSFVKIYDTSIVASVKLTRWLSGILSLPICCDAAISADGPLDRLIIVGGAFGFAGSAILESLGRAIEEAGLVIWISQDFTVIPPKDESGAESPFRKAFRRRHERTGQPSVSFWTTVEPLSRPGRAKSGHLCGPHSTYVNWNALAMRDDIAPKPMVERAARDHLLYYGSYRKDREKSFDRYFGIPVAPTVFSCPSSKVERYPMVKHVEKIGDLGGYLGEFGLGLYLEDKQSHVEFHSPANRHYEMLGAGLPIVYQPEAQRMMERGGYDVADYIAWNAEEIPSLIGRQQEFQDSQRERWFAKAMEEHQALDKIVLDAWERLP